MKTNEKERNLLIDSNKIEMFLDNVLRRNLLPKATHSFASAFGRADMDKSTYAKVELSPSYGLFQKSMYYYNRPLKFIHFTSLKNLVNIIREEKLRMYSLVGMDDKYEFEYAQNVLGKPKNEFLTNRSKSQIYCLSMCKYNLEELQKSLQLWRYFGDDGRGAAIVLDFESKYKYEWFNYVLGEVHYGDKKLNKLRKTVEAYYEFEKANNFKVSGFNKMFHKINSFHKDDIYRDEKEVRLVYSADQDSIFKKHEKINTDITSRGTLTSYKELPINPLSLDVVNQESIEYRLRKINPVVRINKVVFGYRVSKDTAWECIDVLKPYLNKYSYQPIFENTPLKDKFI